MQLVLNQQVQGCALLLSVGILVCYVTVVFSDLLSIDGRVNVGIPCQVWLEQHQHGKHLHNINIDILSLPWGNSEVCIGHQ